MRNLLNNQLYVGTMIWGRTRGYSRGGRAGLREPAPESEWIVKPMPKLRVVSDELWNNVRELKASAVAHYGGRPMPRNAGGASEHMLNAIARCGACGRSLFFMRRNNRSRMYYGSTTLHKGACSNRRGVPMDVLEAFVREKVRGLDEEALWHAAEERRKRWNEEHALERGERAGLERDRKRLEAAVERLTDAIERGESVEGRLKQRQRELADVLAKLAEPAVLHPNRRAFRDGLKTVRLYMGGDVVVEETATERGVRRRVVNRFVESVARGYREALRALGVDRVVVTPEGRG